MGTKSQAVWVRGRLELLSCLEWVAGKLAIWMAGWIASMQLQASWWLGVLREKSRSSGRES